MFFFFCLFFLATAELLALGFVQAEISSKHYLSQGVFNALGDWVYSRTCSSKTIKELL